jgi:electron transport complex protein RnfE
VTDGLAHGAGFAGVLIVLGSVREVLGTGRLFANAEMLLGHAATSLEIDVFGSGDGFLLALLPPGAFLGLALLVALSNMVRGSSMREASRSATDGARVIES